MKIKKIDRNSGIIQSTLTIIGNILATGLSAIAIILITRILGPEKFGIFTVGFSIVLILTKINDMGLNTPVIKFASSNEDLKDRNTIYSLAIKYKLLISTIIALTGIIGADSIAKLLNFPDKTIIILSFTIGLATVYYEQLLAVLQSLHRFTQGVVINALQAASKLILAAVLLFSGIHQVWAVFTAYAISPLLPILFKKQLLPQWVKINLQVKNKDIQNQLFKLAKHSSVALISAGIIENVDVLFVQKNLTAYETGLYSGVSRIAMIVALVAYSLGNVLNARVAKYKDKIHLQKYLKKATGVIILSILGFLIFVPLSKLVIFFTIGPEYYAGNNVLLILTGASFLAIAAIPFIALFYTLEADWYFSIGGILQLAIVLIGNAVFVPLYGLEAAAWTRLVTRGFLFLFTVISGLLMYYKYYGEKTQKTFNHT